jgi:hypothetical protein
MYLKIPYSNSALGFGAAGAQSAGTFRQKMLIKAIFGSCVELN